MEELENHVNSKPVTGKSTIIIIIIIIISFIIIIIIIIRLLLVVLYMIDLPNIYALLHGLFYR